MLASEDRDDAAWIAQRMVLDAGAQAARLRRQASVQAATIREAAEREAAQMRATVMKLSAVPGELVSIDGGVASQEAVRLVGKPGARREAEPRARPTRRPQGTPRQLVAVRVAAAATAALFFSLLPPERQSSCCTDSRSSSSDRPEPVRRGLAAFRKIRVRASRMRPGR
jgi:hypothetical protein